MINYLGRIIYDKESDPQPYAQLVNVPSLEGTLRCRFCRYFVNRRSEDDYYKCREDHRCGEESIFYAPMVNSKRYNHSFDNNHFSPAHITKQHEIDSMKRYLQLWSCDISGFQCCKLCYFYPQRIEKQQTISACANSHDCGQNASYWDLLELRNTILYNFPYTVWPYTYTAKVTFLDGHTTTATPVSLSRDSSGRAIVTLSDGTTSEILLVDFQFPSAWCYLRAPYAEKESWQADMLADLPISNPSTLIILRCDGSRLYEFLIDQGVQPRGLTANLGTLLRVYLGDGVYCILASRLYTADMHSYTGGFTVSIDDVTSGYTVYFKFGTSDYYLGASFAAAEPKQWKKVKVTGDWPVGTTIVTIHSYNSESASFLRAIGVRDSLFQNL